MRHIKRYIKLKILKKIRYLKFQIKTRKECLELVDEHTLADVFWFAAGIDYWEYTAEEQIKDLQKNLASYKFVLKFFK